MTPVALARMTQGCYDRRAATYRATMLAEYGEKWRRIHELVGELRELGVSGRVVDNHLHGEVMTCPYCEDENGSD
mgnify:CR=1 FL=1